MVKKNWFLSACALPLAILSAPIWAQQSAAAVLMTGETFRVTTDDVRADALRIPAQTRSQVLGDPQTVQQLVTNLFVRRGLAQQAEAQGLAQSSAMQAALQIARDKVLSDALLEQMDAQNQVSNAAAEKMAQSTYRAHPERFKAGERVQVRHILIAGSDDAAKQKAQDILQALQQGADFAELAKERSQDPGSATRGGVLRWFEHGAMVPEFEEAAFALQKTGDLSVVVQTKFGFHVLQLQGRKPAGIKAYEEVREELVSSLKAGAQQDARSNAAQKVQAQGKVQDEAIKALAAEFAAQKNQ